MTALFLTLLLGLPQQPPRDAAVAKPATGTASVSGIVVTDEAEPKPVRRARVSIMDIERRAGATVITDDSGRFTARNLAAGRYTVTPHKNAWVGTAYGATRPGRQGTPIAVSDGQTIDKLTVRLSRGGVITGTITDEYGRPLPRANVTTFRYSYVGGTRTLVPAGSGAVSDDRGVYRIYGLSPGQYLVGTNMRSAGFMSPMGGEILQTSDAAIHRALSERGGRGSVPASARRQDDERPTVAYSPVFYPGTAASSQATVITIGTGEERSGIDFPLLLIPTSRIEGTVIGADGAVLANSAVNLISSEVGVVGFGFESFRMSRTNAEGRFTFSGLPPGKYSVLSRAAGPRDAPAPAAPVRPGVEMTTPSMWAMGEVTLDGHTVSGLTLTLQPGFTVSGRLQFSGTMAPPDPTRMRITLMAVTNPGQVNMGTSPAVVNADGTFTITGVTPGSYRMTAMIPGARPDLPGWVLASAVAEGRDMLDLPLQIGQNISDATLSFTDRPAELSGALQDPAGRPAPDYHIIVFASDRTFWTPQSRRIRAMRPSADGRFIIRSLPPGDYLISAVADIEDGEWFDTNVLQQLGRVSMPITIADGEKKTQNIQVGAGR